MSTLLKTLAVLLVMSTVLACGDDDGQNNPMLDAAVDAASMVCTTGNASKIKFVKAEGCQNDGSVEFCIPTGDAAVMSSVTAISASITCMTGGGRAQCNMTTQLLCFYPTTIPDQCVADNGAMTDAAWQDMCEISALPSVAQIVPTIFI